MLGRPISCRVDTATADWGLPSLMRADCRKPGSNERRVGLWVRPTLATDSRAEGSWRGPEAWRAGHSATPVEDAQVAAPEGTVAHMRDS